MNSFGRSSRLLPHVVILSMIVSIVLAACSFGESAPVETGSSVTGPIHIETLEDLQAVFKEINRAAPVEAQSRADELWQTLADSERVPLVLGTQVVFLYKGDAERVHWRGSFNGWSTPGLPGVRVGETDLWIAYIEFPEASRIEYKMMLNEKDWFVDPASPNTSFNGMTGVTNVLALPGFSVTDEGKKRTDIKHGTLTESLSLESTSLGYTVNYWVYLPSGYENSDRLPVLYVLDGNDFVDERMGVLPNVLDNLIADQRIEPVMAVLIDAREPGNPQNNRREQEFLVHPVEHANFISDELAPTIDRAYQTDPRPEARLITGVSYGGISAGYIASFRPDVFHNVAMFSPSFWVIDNPQFLADPQQAEGAQLMVPTVAAATECGEGTGFECPRLPLKVFLSGGWANWDVGDFSGLVATLQEQGYPTEFHQVREGHTWDNWRGLSDEMLIYFFGTD